ncbi:hypothetical protein [Nocardia alni]|uniref:hypothetical protein n=1 Tax=Nocardia alni TaxID=2815723 RepID=UPI001C250AA4|nr:hypothetical protein [Nocardia alni]
MSGTTQVDHAALMKARQTSTDAVDQSTQRARTQLSEAESASSFWKGGANSAATAAAVRMHDRYQKLVQAADQFHASIGSADSSFSNTESDSTQHFTNLL